MTRLVAQTLTVLVLMAGAVIVAARALHLWRTPIVIDLTEAKAASRPTPRAIADLPRVSIAQFSQTLARPLFFQGRRFPKPRPKKVKAEPKKPAPVRPPPPPPKPVTLPAKIKLLGVVLRAEDRKALIANPPQPAQWFAIGDRIGDWTVAGIEENRVVLRHSVRSATLPLYSEGASKRAPMTPQPTE